MITKGTTKPAFFVIYVILISRSNFFNLL